MKKYMKKLLRCPVFLLSVSIFVFFGFTQIKEHTKPLSEIMVYCNSVEFIKEMSIKDYRLSLAARGSITDKHHQGLVEMNFLINNNTKTWAIIFNTTNYACIVGGQRVVLIGPKSS